MLFRISKSASPTKQSAIDENSDECANFSPKSFVSEDTEDCSVKGNRKVL